MPKLECTILEFENHAVLTPAYPDPVTYIRIVERTMEVGDEGPSTVEREVAYWDKAEWQNDPDLSCIGAIMGSMTNVFGGALTAFIPSEQDRRRIP